MRRGSPAYQSGSRTTRHLPQCCPRRAKEATWVWRAGVAHAVCTQHAQSRLQVCDILDIAVNEEALRAVEGNQHAGVEDGMEVSDEVCAATRLCP